MAQGMFAKMLLSIDGDYFINSAGIYTHKESVITPQADKQLKARGIDLTGRKSVQITKKLVDASDFIFTMTGGHRRLLVESYPYAADKIHLLGDHTNRGGDVIDPYGSSDKIYEACAKEIEEMLNILVDMI